ncbi:MAG TPA: aminotransferase class I/II-fold pyridoxal phosphate-dependent enzyme [Dongiaceae bacterium]|nr:aminotransferase class I/II-fold pyridoxal phosphate-dependent enzyme [Dongiaceae bacterium]
MIDLPTTVVKPRTLTASALSEGEPFTRALTPAIHVATTYIRDADNGYSSGNVYGRGDNTSVRQAESLISELEGAAESLLFGSGMAAATALFLSLEPTHIVAPHLMYWGLRTWLQQLPRFGHQVSFVDMSDLDAVKAAIRPGETGLVWIETPSNPLWTITDIAAVADCAHSAGALVAADSTVATPILTRPLAYGADIVMHSATKYLNGHSDVSAGVLAAACPHELWSRIRKMREQHGAVLGPFEAWLLTRGLRTLDVRVKAQSKSAEILARRLTKHAAISAVLYPGLIDSPGHRIAASQMTAGFGGMLSIRLKGGARTAIAAAANVNIWRRATSFGGIESLIEHRASMEGEGSPCPVDLLRLSVGLEDPDDLFCDLDRAIARSA